LGPSNQTMTSYRRYKSQNTGTFVPLPTLAVNSPFQLFAIGQ